jgi:copper chaperone CopZ
MAGIIQVGMLAFFWSSASAAPASFEAAGIEADGIEEGNQFVYELKGLHCPGCAAEMEYKIQEMEGVESADILFSKKLLILETSLARTNLKLLAKNMRDLGYCELRMVYPQDETRDQSDGRDDINVAK